MSAGRKTTIVTPVEKPAIDHKAIQQGTNALQITGRQELQIQESVRWLAKQLGYEGPLLPDSLEDGVRESKLRAELELFATGARLLLLKEQCPHGEFIERCDRLGFNPVMAQRTMRSTLKFSNASTSTHLAALGKSKLFELLILDNEETEEFVAGGSVRGITYDNAAKMTVSELRTALREAESRIKAKDTVTADQQTTITKLHEQLALARAKPVATGPVAYVPPNPAEEVLDNVDEQTREIATLIITPLRSVFVQLAKVLSVNDPIYRQAIGASVGRILAVTRKVAADFDIPVSGPAAVEIDEDAQWDEIWAASLRDLDGGQPPPVAASGDGNVTPD